MTDLNRAKEDSMAYDIIRWICGAVFFAVLLTILCIVSKKKGKAAVTAAFIAIILTAVSFVIPFENYIHPFSSVEKLFAYRYHEELVTYFECDEGVVCIAERNNGSNVNYCFNKKDGKLLLPFSLVDDTQHRSSKYGVYLIKKFENQTLIFTQVSDSAYDGKDFTVSDSGYYYCIVDGNFLPSRLTCSGEKVVLV